MLNTSPIQLSYKYKSVRMQLFLINTNRYIFSGKMFSREVFYTIEQKFIHTQCISRKRITPMRVSAFSRCSFSMQLNVIRGEMHRVPLTPCTPFTLTLSTAHFSSSSVIILRRPFVESVLVIVPVTRTNVAIFSHLYQYLKIVLWYPESFTEWLL